jgi:hypothetical protein
MARRKVIVRDVEEILEHWQAGRGIRTIARSLGASRPIVRKYVGIAEAHGYQPGGIPPPQGWRTFLQEVAPEIFNPALGSTIFAELHSRHEKIKETLAHTNLMTAWLRLREELGLKASYSSFRRYVLKHLPGVFRTGSGYGTAGGSTARGGGADRFRLSGPMGGPFNW